MKRIMTIFAVVAAILASCSKSEPETGKNDVNENGRIKINLSVSNPGSGDDSKALVKTDWADGDQLLIWFDENSREKPDMAIKYNGSGWEQDGSVTLSGNSPEASGSMKVLYNNILCVTAKDPYTFNIGTSTLSGKIQTWTFLTEIQVVVTGLTPEDYAKYTLSCSNFTPFTGYTVGTDAITAQAGDANTPVPGISNTDGVAFVFASCTKYGTSAEYKFSLSDGSSSGASASTPANPEFVDLGLPSGLKWAVHNVGASSPEEYGYYFFWGGTQGYIYSTAKDYTLTKNLAQNVSQIKGIKIASSKFSEKKCWVKAENGVELVDGFCWENTPYSNSNGNKFTKYVPSSKTSYWGGTGSPDNKLQLDPADDAARAYCGEGYRMPTSAEFKELYDNTTCTWTTDYNGTGIQGRVFTSKIDTSKKVFFPAAGSGGGTSLSAGSYGYYWSSSLYSSIPYNAYYLYFYSSDVYPQYSYYGRSYGFTVRPVSDQ